MAVIGEQVAVDDVGEVPLQAPAGFLGSLGLGQLASVIDLARTGVADLADGDDVQGGVELTVAAPVQPMPTDVAA
jgi:hypothetical protein